MEIIDSTNQQTNTRVENTYVTKRSFVRGDWRKWDERKEHWRKDEKRELSRVYCAPRYTFWYTRWWPVKQRRVASVYRQTLSLCLPIFPFVKQVRPSSWLRNFLFQPLSVTAHCKSHTICQISTSTRPTTLLLDYTSRRRVWRWWCNRWNSFLLERMTPFWSSATRPLKQRDLWILFVQIRVSYVRVRYQIEEEAKRRRWDSLCAAEFVKMKFH